MTTPTPSPLIAPPLIYPTRLEVLNSQAHEKLRDAERAWHALAGETPVGPARERAFETFENIRLAARVR